MHDFEEMFGLPTDYSFNCTGVGTSSFNSNIYVSSQSSMFNNNYCIIIYYKGMLEGEMIYAYEE